MSILMRVLLEKRACKPPCWIRRGGAAIYTCPLVFGVLILIVVSFPLSRPREVGSR